MMRKNFATVVLMIISSLTPFLGFAQETSEKQNPPKMKIEIWSDVMCPFCYIGTRKIEKAIDQFPQKSQVEIEWKSFQLNPNMETDTSKNVIEYLAEVKGIPLEQAKAMNNHVTQMAAGMGLTYNMNEAVVANSFNAHRFTHFAKTKGKQLEAEEALFKAYFTDGLNTDDLNTLAELSQSIGIPKKETLNMLNSNQFADEVNQDILESRQLGVQGVPFFVFDRKYAISGAQEDQVFTNTLAKAFEEWQTAQEKPKLKVVEGESCKPDGNCD